jgi:pimeloyl-ACP methyl ester carboxylesterase
MRRALPKDAGKVLTDFAAACLAPAEAAFQAEAAGWFQPEPDEAHLAAGLDYLLRADVRSRLPQLAIKPVIVQGREDRIVPPEQAWFLHERLPGSRLILLPTAGHLLFVTQAVRFDEIVREVLKELAGEDRGHAVPASSPTPPSNPL